MGISVSSVSSETGGEEFSYITRVFIDKLEEVEVMCGVDTIHDITNSGNVKYEC